MTTAWQETLSPRPAVADVQALVSEITAELIEAGYECAPHVVAKLARRVNNDLRTVCEIAATLTPAQRCGHRVLPRVLPLTPSIADAFDVIEWGRDEQFMLLLAALCTVEQLDVLLEASGFSVADISSGSFSVHLNVDHGRFEFVDLRLSIWMLRHADAVETARAHERLQHVHRARGEYVVADWHRARGALLRAPEVVAPLLAEARELSERGHPEWGSSIATEAAEHAAARDHEEARLIAGAAMMGAGYVDDAANWLGSLFPDGAREHRANALPSVIIAETCLHGAVPVIDPTELRPSSGDPVHWHAWARTAGLAALLCAERAEHSAMRVWLRELREADARAGAQGTVRDPVVALCWLLTSEVDSPEVSGEGPFSGGVVGALRAALDGDIADGLRTLSRARAGLINDVDPLIAGFENSPLVAAYLVVVEALLHFWRGDIERARSLLLSAVVELPIGIPFAGLGSTLAHRLDIAVLGTPGVLAQALAKTLPSGIRVDRLVDGAIEAYLAGGTEQSARSLTLWHDRDSPQQPLAVPGLDEVGPVDGQTHIEPPELADARALRRRIRSLPEASWRREHADVAAAGCALKSPFERARVEAMLGAVSVIRGDSTAGRQHLRTAECLFNDAGANAWRDAITSRLTRLSEQRAANAAMATMPIAVVQDTDPLAASRSAWAPVLTGRELEVAMRVIEGLPNREIADKLDVSVRTVEVHTGRIFGKLGVRNRVQLTVLAHRTARHL